MTHQVSAAYLLRMWKLVTPLKHYLMMSSVIMLLPPLYQLPAALIGQVKELGLCGSVGMIVHSQQTRTERKTRHLGLVYQKPLAHTRQASHK